MGQISDIRNPWREQLLGEQASFRGVRFYTESGSRASGRRAVVHEYPKRNDPYVEDMGRHARRFSFSGYLIYRVRTPPGFAPYVQQRALLVQALEDDDIGELVHPVYAAGGTQAVCERYSMVESRERGGFTQFEMTFVEHGNPGNSMVIVDTLSNVTLRADNAVNAAKTMLGLTLQRAK
jgi:prophage DNA circulation protein